MWTKRKMTLTFCGLNLWHSLHDTVHWPSNLLVLIHLKFWSVFKQKSTTSDWDGIQLLSYSMSSLCSSHDMLSHVLQSEGHGHAPQDRDCMRTGLKSIPSPQQKILYAPKQETLTKEQNWDARDRKRYNSNHLTLFWCLYLLTPAQCASSIILLLTLLPIGLHLNRTGTISES